MKRVETVIFISNFFNHHQKPFSDAMYKKLGDGYLFIETAQMTRDRKQLGWGLEQYPSYVVSREMFCGNAKKYMAQIKRADAVIIGSASNRLVAERIFTNRLVFRYSERPLKKGFEFWKYPYRFAKWHWMNPPGKQIYMLCASAYTAQDYAAFHLFKQRCYKWGYFPQTYHYENLEDMLSYKKPASILWSARFIAWKHPEYVLEVARRLKANNYDFHIQMMGNGELWDTIDRQIREQGLEEQVELLGAIPSDQVRAYMDTASIFMFTSDRNEGWGAVLNESMNSACAVVADRAIGSVPFLLKDGENGLVYDTCNVDQLYEKVKFLLDNPEEGRRLGRRAYETITEEWNAETAARRFLTLCEAMLQDKKAPVLYASGLCSRAEIIKE